MKQGFEGSSIARLLPDDTGVGAVHLSVTDIDGSVSSINK
jgi:hypothetical protein